MFELELVDPNVSIKFASVLPDGLVRAARRQAVAVKGNSPVKGALAVGRRDARARPRSTSGHMTHRKGRNFNDIPRIEYN